MPLYVRNEIARAERRKGRAVLRRGEGLIFYFIEEWRDAIYRRGENRRLENGLEN